MSIDNYKIENDSTEEVIGVLQDCFNILIFTIRNLSVDEGVEYYRHHIKELQKQVGLITFIQKELEKRDNALKKQPLI